jgi:hypothetical protein
MKIFSILFIFLNIVIITPGQTPSPPLQEKNYTIHTSKRAFIKKRDRVYLKNKMKPAQEIKK